MSDILLANESYHQLRVRSLLEPVQFPAQFADACDDFLAVYLAHMDIALRNNFGYANGLTCDDRRRSFIADRLNASLCRGR